MLAWFLLAAPAGAKQHWSELNVGPFYVDTDENPAGCREALTQLEQMRWVLGNLLETKDLPSVWPIRIMLTNQGGSNARPEFVLRGSQYLLVISPQARLPLGDIAGILLDGNTPRLPVEVEAGLRQLFTTLEAHGSRVTWGGAPAHPDSNWARMQLFATKFEYGASFHVFLTALRGGSTLQAAERNAFGKPDAELENEAKANLARGTWTAVPVSGRPLDPKRDFGEHSMDDAMARVFLANWTLSSDPKGAEATFKSTVEAGGAMAPLGYEGLAELSKLNKQDATTEWDNAVRAGSHSATVYVEAARNLPPAEALPLLKRAAQLNDRWAEPIYQQAQIAPTPGEKESLLKAALKLDPRATAYWIELAQLQTVAGEGTAAQGSWLRAEDSAPNEAERARVHDLRTGSEQQRLDAAAEATRRDRDSVHLADERAERAESQRIHAAERKANQALDGAAKGEKPADVVEWNALAGQHKLSGLMTRVDCLKSGWRVFVKDKAGNTTQLFLDKESNAGLACGPLPRPRRATLEYRGQIDEDLHTSGVISTLQVQ